MKKLLFIIALITLSFSANAQKSKAVKAAVKAETVSVKPEQEATKDAKQLQQILGLDDTKTQDFQRLFQQKYETLAIKDLSEDRKNELSKVVDLKIKASLDADQMAKLESNKEFYTKLVK